MSGKKHTRMKQNYLVGEVRIGTQIKKLKKEAENTKKQKTLDRFIYTRTIAANRFV